MAAALRNCVSESYSFFIREALEITKAEIEAEKDSKSNDTGEGCVYVFESDTEVLYVGQTGTSLWKRARFETSKHIKKDWWKSVKKIRVCQLANPADRLVLEMLLIVKLKPSINRRPSRGSINDMKLGF